MRYRIQSGDWHSFGNPEHVIPLNYGGDVVIAIDPGKTNMAFTVGDPYGVVLSYVEISGQGCNTTEYCTDFVNFFRRFLSYCHPIRIGVEAAVSYKGMQYHVSQMVLTEIRANILQMITQVFGLAPIEINNWAWKKAILPEGFRSTSEKGSLRYLATVGFTKATHDVTDSICMYLYLQRTMPKYKDPYCDKSESSPFPYKLIIFTEDCFVPADELWTYEYNPKFSLSENANYYVNRTHKNGYLTVPAETLSLEDIYGNTCVSCGPSQTLKVVVSRL